MPTVIAPTHVKLQNILFATDFTPSAQLALSYTLNLAHRYDAEVYVVNVLPHLPFVETVQPDPEQIRFLAQQQLAALVGSQSFKGVRHKKLIEEEKLRKCSTRWSGSMRLTSSSLAPTATRDSGKC